MKVSLLTSCQTYKCPCYGDTLTLLYKNSDYTLFFLNSFLCPVLYSLFFLITMNHVCIILINNIIIITILIRFITNKRILFFGLRWHHHHCHLYNVVVVILFFPKKRVKKVHLSRYCLVLMIKLILLPSLSVSMENSSVLFIFFLNFFLCSLLYFINLLLINVYDVFFPCFLFLFSSFRICAANILVNIFYDKKRSFT